MARQELAQTTVARVWRGFLARDKFSLLLLAACEKALSSVNGSATRPLEQASMASNHNEMADGDSEAEVAQPALSLEEAHALAAGSMFLHRREALGADEAGSKLLASPGGPVAHGAVAHATLSHERPVEPRDTSIERLSCASGGGTPSKGPATMARESFGGAGGDGAARDEANALEFTAAMAEEMSFSNLKELAAVLSRIIASRNRYLVTLLEKRDELEHERLYRETLVQQLLTQVNRSRGLSKRGSTADGRQAKR